jgi:hypothetical protein
MNDQAGFWRTLRERSCARRVWWGCGWSRGNDRRRVILRVCCRIWLVW